MALNFEQLLRAFLSFGDVADSLLTFHRKPQSIIEKLPSWISSVSQET
jgi:hypothetical protein